MATHYDRNKAKYVERAKDWHAKNPDKVKKAKRKYYEKNRAKSREDKRRYKARHPDRVAQELREWRAANPEATKRITRMASYRRFWRKWIERMGDEFSRERELALFEVLDKRLTKEE